jgi:hypothetical protein
MGMSHLKLNKKWFLSSLFWGQNISAPTQKMLFVRPYVAATFMLLTTATIFC